MNLKKKKNVGLAYLSDMDQHHDLIVLLRLEHDHF
jgi:hypothetical protein